MSLSFQLEDAYLWDVRDRQHVRIDEDGLFVDIHKDDVDYVIEPVST